MNVDLNVHYLCTSPLKIIETHTVMILYYIVHGLFVTIMVTTKRPYVRILIDSLLVVRYIETHIHIHTACLDVH